ncbi:uncharacterized protein F4822DRAFT_242562 [Hypoxylon trugodes]|uniref:uncharacterized protein n=1 Tax=Hypoxylon trugodes TaxID=326681 RepID=UPI00219495B4|nr:uncharacterized protein F4822DRAFT_242562 [Hypoxylon trugodes]KAI1388339.1 hypothetical protein F4822DRAFT_242562 [Hypoxylon trugodes]
MASSFFRFTSLPTELRLQIWEAALYDESEDRLVPMCIADLKLIYKQEVSRVDTPPIRLWSGKWLASPFLSVNRECRQTAKAFYNFIDVHRIPLDRDHPFLTSAGLLYLNLDRDIFIKHYNSCPTEPAWSLLDDFITGSVSTKIKYCTSPMGQVDCERVRRICTAVSGHQDGISPYPNRDLYYPMCLCYCKRRTHPCGLPYNYHYAIWEQQLWPFSKATARFDMEFDYDMMEWGSRDADPGLHAAMVEFNTDSKRRWRSELDYQTSA